MSRSGTSSAAGDILDFLYPYRDRYETFRRLPAQGVSREELLRLVDEIAEREDAPARAGRISGSLYHGGAAGTPVQAASRPAGAERQVRSLRVP